MVEFPTSSSHQAGQRAASPEGSSRLERSVLCGSADCHRQQACVS